jgi:hypothetical protein
MASRSELLPAFEVEEMNGTETVMQYQYVNEYVLDDDGTELRDADNHRIMKSRERKEVAVEQPRGWMVYFPRGHSVHVRTRKEMQRLGYLDAPQRVDLDGDTEPDDHPVGQPTTLKERSRRLASPARRTKAPNNSIEAELEV